MKTRAWAWGFGLWALGCSEKREAPPVVARAAAVHDARPIEIDAAPPDAAPPPSVTFAVANNNEISLYAIGDRGVQLVRSVQVAPLKDVEALVWTGPDALYALLDDDRVVRVTDTITPVPPLPARTWRVAHDHDEVKLAPVSSLFASGGELWMGHCDWGSTDGEMSSCDEWVYARLVPAPHVVQRESPEQAPDRALPEITPPANARVTMTIVPEVPVDAMPGDTYVPAPRGILRCTIDHRTIEYPPPDARDSAFEGIEAVHWLAADPPLAAVDRKWPTYDGSEISPVLFEGCTPVEHGGTLTVGPHDVVALTVDFHALLWWHGRRLGSVPADRLAFAP